MKEVYPKRDPFREPAESFYRGRFESGLQRRRFGPSLTVGVLAVALFAAIIWYTYPSGEGEGDAAVPVIQADARPFKTLPDDPGGIDIPFQDSVIFSDLEPASGGADAETETLLPGAEEPVAKGDIISRGTEEFEIVVQDETGKVTASEAENLLAEAEALLAEAENTAAFGGLDGDIEISVAEGEDGKELEIASVATKPTPAAEAAKTDAAVKVETTTKAALTTGETGGYAVQLGSLTSRDAAEKEWARLQKIFKDQLGGLDLFVQEANLAKGTYYRVQAGRLTKADASAICDTIKAKNPGGCIVVKR